MDNEIRNQLVEYYSVGMVPRLTYLGAIIWNTPVSKEISRNHIVEIHSYMLENWDHKEAWGSVENANTWTGHQGLLGLAEYLRNKKQLVTEMKTNSEIKSYYDDIPVSDNKFRHMIESMHDVGVAETFHAAISALDKTEQKQLLNLITIMGDQTVATPTELMFLGKRITDLLSLLEKFFANAEPEQTAVIFNEGEEDGK